MRPLPVLHVSLTTAELRHGVLLVTKQRVPLDEPLGPSLRAEAWAQASSATEAEARWLLAARDPGVVAVRRVEPDRCRLSTEHVAVASLATRYGSADPDPGDPADPASGSIRAVGTGVAVADVLAQVAGAVARLHARDLVHGALTPEHILLARPRTTEPVSLGRGLGRHRAVLCSPSTAPASPEDDLVALLGLARQWQGRVERRRAAWDNAIGLLGGELGPPPAAAVAQVLARLTRSLQRPPSATEVLAAARSRVEALTAQLKG